MDKILPISTLREWLFAWRKEEITMSRLRELIIEELQKNKLDTNKVILRKYGDMVVVLIDTGKKCKCGGKIVNDTCMYRSYCLKCG